MTKSVTGVLLILIDKMKDYAPLFVLWARQRT